MNISDVTSIIQVVLILCAAGAVISGIVKARRAKKNGRSKFFCIGSIAVGVILAMLSIAIVICLGSVLDNSGDYIKAQHPIGVPNITYGQALDKVCGNQKWYRMGSETSSSGEAIVQMEADCNYGGAVHKITIQFSYGARDLEQIDADTPFEITFVGFDDSTETSVSVMQDLIYEMFVHYAADNAMELDTSVKNIILYSSGWNVDKITSNRAETATGTIPQENDIQDDEEYNPLFEEFSELMHQYVDFSGMNDGEIQSYLEDAYEQWLLGEAYDEIVFDENLELTLQDIGDYAYLSEDDIEGDLSDFSYNELYLYGGSYEGGDGSSIGVGIYSSFDEGNIVGNIFLYDALYHETYAAIRDDGDGEGIYTLYFDDSSVMYIRFYQDSTGTYYADVQGLDAIYTNADPMETYIMTEQYIP